jgi:hypothetical protein
MAMTISDAPGPAVRRASAYRAAVWCDRVAFACLLLYWVGVFSGVVDAATVAGYLPWSALVLLASSLVLLRLAGIRLTYRTIPWRIADKEIATQYFRDLIGLSPK